jgi:predicted Rossmann fold nucleotide-binding protein DprA/Smf involved in DNA uptake
MKKVAVVGNREGWTKKEVFDALDKYVLTGENINIITGGADGVDTYAMEYAKRKGCVLTIYYPDIVEYDVPMGFYERNKRIAWECETLIAFNRKERSGTSQTIRMAKDFKKEVIEIR